MKKLIFIFGLLFSALLLSNCEDGPELIEEESMIPVAEEMEQEEEIVEENEEVDEEEAPEEEVDEEEMTEEEDMNPFSGKGVFETNSDYATSGSFTLIETENSYTLSLDEAFSVGGGIPDLVIYLSNSTTSQQDALFISEDIADNGAQSFNIPLNIAVEDYQYVLLYCRRFNEKVGFGPIELNE